ncbi:MAG: hypothetical protein QW594_02055, partial [Candidatus Woesearchaeota archaeon]
PIRLWRDSDRRLPPIRVELRPSAHRKVGGNAFGRHPGSPTPRRLYRIDKDIITEEIHNRIFVHHKIKVKDLYS